MKQPVVFLDFDQTLNIDTDAPFDPEKIKIISDLCEAADACIVITSNQRLIRKWEDLSETLYLAGLSRSVPVVGETPSRRYSEGDRSRWAEISNWLTYNDLVDGCWVIIDDACGGSPPEDRTVVVNSKIGLTPPDGSKALEILLDLQFR